MGEFVRLEQRDLTVAQYEAKFIELSRFSSQLISIEEEKALKFQDGLKPYLENKISILKLSVYLDVTPRPDEGHSICNCSGTYVHQVPL